MCDGQPEAKDSVAPGHLKLFCIRLQTSEGISKWCGQRSEKKQQFSHTEREGGGGGRFIFLIHEVPGATSGTLWYTVTTVRPRLKTAHIRFPQKISG